MSKKDVLFSIVIGILIIFSFINFNKMSDIEERMLVLNNVQNDIQNVNHSVQNISTQVHMKLVEFLQEQLWISEKGYEITNVDLEGKTIDVTLDWSMRDLLQHEKVSFLYREESTSSY